MMRQVFSKLLTHRSVLSSQQITRRCLSLQQNGSSSTVSRILPSISILTPIPSKAPSIQESFREIDVKIWRLPQRIPVPVIPIPDVTPVVTENPEMPQIEKQAARMIVIRRRKMKKHKLKKLRKKMKFEYRRLAAKRKSIKEKNFQMELSSQIQLAKSFDAKVFVEDMIRKAREVIVYERPPRNPAQKKNPALYDEKGRRIKLNEHLYAKQNS